MPEGSAYHVGRPQLCQPVFVSALPNPDDKAKRTNTEDTEDEHREEDDGVPPSPHD
jgi:hypothetical protein